ncbi:MAG: SPOR domain-containing protein [Saprospiraceae bacterium]|nr:SPOR domain-containing protein [Saprospiraceae bacterium]
MRARKSILLTVAAMMFAFASFAQLFQGPLGKANKQYELHAYNLAIQSYKEALDRRPNDEEALSKLADCYRHLNQMEEAAKYYVRAMAQKGVKTETKLEYAHVLKAIGQYDEARRWYLEYAKDQPEEGTHYAQSCNFAKGQTNVPSQFMVVSEFVNSSASDFGPTFLGDGQVIFSSARTDIQRTSSNWTGKANNQLFIASVGRDNHLESPYFLKSDTKNTFNEGPVSYTRDGRWVAYTQNNFVDGTRHIASSGMNLSIQIAELSSTGDWINPTAFQYNGSDFSVGFPCFSADGKALYFSSNRIDGFGGYDLYVSYRIGAGNNWSAPQNLGSVVNSPGNEVTPYVDGENLYFASDWHEGLGGYDVFRAELVNNRWARIFHMGNGVNSPRDDYGFIYDSFRNRGFLVSNRPGGRGNEDLYSVYKSGDNVVIKVKNAADGSPLANATVDFSACGEGAFIADSKGEYTFQAMRGLECNLLIRKDGYISKSILLSTVGVQQQREYQVMLSRVGEEYAGRVVSYTTRLPLDDVTVIATNQTTSTEMTQKSNLSGDYMLALNPNTIYIVRYSRQGYRDINRTVRTGGTFDRDVLGVISMIPVDAVITDDQTARDPLVNTNDPSVNIPRGYAIQVAALGTPNLSGFDDLKNLGDLYYKEENRKYKIRVGVFSTRADAERVLSLVKNQGYKGSFIVEEEGGQTGGTLTPKTPVTKPSQPTTASGRYKIQLAAYSNVRNFDDSKISGLGTIEEKKRGNLTIKYLAAYTTIEEARQVLREAKAAGFKDAYIVEDIDGDLKKVK